MRRAFLIVISLSALSSRQAFSLFGFELGGQKHVAFLEEQRLLVALEQARPSLTLTATASASASSTTDGSHQCTNRFSKKSFPLYESRVNDGVCDCCDGSDETVGITTCADTCSAQAQHELNLRAKRQTAYASGSSVRSDAIAVTKSKLETTIATALAGFNDEAALTSNLEELERRRTFAEKVHAERLAQREQRLEDIRINTRPRVDAILGFESPLDLASFSAALMDLFGVNRKILEGYLPSDFVSGDEGDSEDDQELSEEGGDAEGGEERRPKGSLCSQIRAIDERLAALPCPPKNANTDADADADAEPAAQVMLERLRETAYRIIENNVGASDEAAERIQMLLVHYRLHGSFGAEAVEFAKTADASQGACLGAFGSLGGDGEGGEVIAKMNCEVAQSLSEALQLLVATKQDVEGNMGNNEALEKGAESLRSLEAEIEDVKARQASIQTARQSIASFDGFFEFLWLKEQSKCLSKADGQYTYSVCMCDSVHQQDTTDFISASSEDGIERFKHGTSLGNFDRLERNAETGGVDMFFTNGQHCHAFGPRSAVIRIECGVEELLLSASEPSTCAYELKMELPHACSPEYAAFHNLETSL